MLYTGHMGEHHDIMASDDLLPGQLVEISWQGEDLLLYRAETGECRAITAYCPHMGNYMPNGLAPGEALSSLIKGSDICCPFHGWCFDGQGRCTHIPPDQRIPAAVSKGRAIAKSWRAMELDGRIYIQVVGKMDSNNEH